MNYAETKKRRIELKNKLEEWAGKIIEATADIEQLKKEMKDQTKVFLTPNLTHSEVAGRQKTILETKSKIDKSTKSLNTAVRMEKETQEKLIQLEK
jgi:hypothetical protein|tara:strand:+ start:3265 stop:3552 length:288 start_codon:yes stop_codon:yes gene_type:complete